ncbi:lysylphosphatidylglycerol synthase domain-containing protein [Billgrantia lactosivorans]|uniref:lysylphosphatidylglycerol synthase domain-containing protein n=1 Tax=Billgrantia lactosivorans TaxID=2185141 RepID=UPI000DABC173|nr:lysylphosphatidylglycerol synthase domain-containing protein [Halomonas lactosivorans]
MKVADRPTRPRPWLRWLKHGVTLLFFILIAVLLVSMARNVDWPEVVETLRDYRPLTLAAGVGITAASYAAFSSYDLLGKRYTGHGLSARQVLQLAFVCYAFNLNLGAWVGSLAMRYRLYTRLGLGVATVTRILSVSLIANWLGYMLLAGVVFSARLLELPASWEIGATGLQLLGVGLLATACGYLAACRFSRRRTWHVRGHEIVLPPLRLALLQAALGAANWSLMALLVYLLLPEGVFFPSILGILLISAVAGVITHIPAGLGVLEAVFLALLQHQVASSQILAALIGYRALYFLLPLAVACVLYLVLERRGRQRQRAEAGHEG